MQEDRAARRLDDLGRVARQRSQGMRTQLAVALADDPLPAAIEPGGHDDRLLRGARPPDLVDQCRLRGRDPHVDLAAAGEADLPRHLVRHAEMEQARPPAGEDGEGFLDHRPSMQPPDTEPRNSPLAATTS